MGLHDFKGFAFPKPERKKKSVKAAAVAPEATVQAEVDARLGFARIPYLRLTDTLMRAIFANPQIPIHIKAVLADELGGWPDNIALLPVSSKYALCCLIECKSETGKLHGRQKQRSAALPYNVVRSGPEADALVRDFEFMAGLISDAMRVREERKPST